MATSVSYGTLWEFESIILSNAVLRAVIIPELGGRVWELEDRVRNRQWIWHREDVPLQTAYIGSVYDDVWAGGWEELFPNDAPCSFEGRELPDHGEWWATPWEVDKTVSGRRAEVHLKAQTSVIRTQCTKTYILEDDEAKITVNYLIKSCENQPFYFLFKQHLAIDITSDCRLVLPGGRVTPVDTSFGTLISGAGPFDWPLGVKDNENVDLQLILPRNKAKREFLYVQNLPQPWCGINDLSNSASLRMDFRLNELPYVWLFLSYGGWRNLYTAVLEPCSNLPKDLPEAVKIGQSARLDPGQAFQTTVSVTLGTV